MERITVAVQTSARLHLGFYNFLSDSRVYGSLGVAIKHPELYLKATLNTKREVKASSDYSRLKFIVENVARKLGVEGYHVVFEKTLPKHVGLGSTTQTYLAVASAFSKLLGMKVNVRKLAALFSRGDVSGIGIAAFEKGGFIVDCGRKRPPKGILKKPERVEDLPPILFRARIPSSWKFVIIVPSKIRGLSETEETTILEKPQKPPKKLQNMLYSLLLNNIIPSILEEDINVFGKALTKLQFLVGKYFSKHQKGIFCCYETEKIIEMFSKLKCKGYGQSSWGPAAYCIVEGYRRATKILLKTMEHLEFEASGFITEARNYGAKIITLYS